MKPYNIKMWAGKEGDVKRILDYFAACGYKVEDMYYDVWKNYRAFFAYTDGQVTQCQDDRDYFDNHNSKQVFLATPVHEFIEVPEIDTPLGIRPRSVAEAQRAVEILEGMIRYANAGVKIPVDWRDELLRLDKIYEDVELDAW